MCLPCWSYKDVAFDNESEDHRRYAWDGKKYVLSKVRVELFFPCVVFLCFVSANLARGFSAESSP